jgi:hypothetical protein
MPQFSHNLPKQLIVERTKPLGKEEVTGLIGAGDGIRTRNPQLGKLMRYRCATPAQRTRTLTATRKIVKEDAECQRVVLP